MANNQSFDWLNLVDISGPFLSNQCIKKSFPNGLEAQKRGLRQELRLAYEEWLTDASPKVHEAWTLFVIRHALDYDDECVTNGEALAQGIEHLDEMTGERVRATYMVASFDEPPQPIMPIMVVPKGQKLHAPVAGSQWMASPQQRLASLLKTNNISHGLVTNGDQWCLVHVCEGEATGYIVFQMSVMIEEEELLRAFCSLLGIRKSIGAAEGDSLKDMLLESRNEEEELTNDLGKQVRQSIELLVRCIDQLDEDSSRTLLQNVDNTHLYRGCLTVMMRIMFLLCAEERKLLPMEESQDYVDSYAVSTMLSQLENEAQESGEEILERRHDAWMRLMALSRLVYSGSSLPELQMTPYGGSLFNPDSYPILESLKVNNRVTLHILERMQYILVDGASGKERRRVSFESLDVEQIGYVYESLLDHSIFTASETVLGLVGKSSYEPELRISELEKYGAKGTKELVKFLKGETNRQEKALEKMLSTEPDHKTSDDLRRACGGNQAVIDEVMPYANIIRCDSVGQMQIYRQGERYVSTSDERRGTGTHYTPKALAEEIVQHALEPLLFEGLAEGKNLHECRKRSSSEILQLKIADIAMGSGAFLVAVCRFLSEKITEAWNHEEEVVQKQIPGAKLACNEKGILEICYDPRINIENQQVETELGTLKVSDAKGGVPLPSESEERIALARSMIVDRCLYGVDINPMATEMAKLSLWLLTMRRDRPFHFLDHALKCGDSLVGVTLEELESFSLTKGKKQSLLLPWVPEAVARVRNLRRAIRETPSDTVMGVHARETLHKRAEEDEAALRVAADCLLAGEFDESSTKKAENTRFLLMASRPEQERIARLGHILGRPSFHYDLEFADVFEQGGFDCIVGNPPFLWGRNISGIFGTAFRNYLVQHIANGVSARADLCAYFFLKTAKLLKSKGTFGLIATNSICEGDVREVGLDQLLATRNGQLNPIMCCYKAVKSVKWPTKSANLQVAKIWAIKGQFGGEKILDGNKVLTISPMLDSEQGDRRANRLGASQSITFQGSIFLGDGFVMEIEQAQILIEKNPDLSKVLFPLLNGDDLNNQFRQAPARWIINFHNWPLGRVGQKMPVSQEDIVEEVRRVNPTRTPDYFATREDKWVDPSKTNEENDKQQKKWLQVGLVPADYPLDVAADFPEALSIVETEVKPERQRPSEKGPDKHGRNFQLRHPMPEKFWHYAEKRPALYASIEPLKRCLSRTVVSQYHNFAWLPTNIVISSAAVVCATDRDGFFALVQSHWHQAWTEKNSSSLETRQRYTPSDCFETFAMPSITELMDTTGKTLDSARNDAMEKNNVGLTAISKMLHNPSINTPEIVALREAIIANDEAVSQAYGWDVPLDHEFYDSGRGPRFTVSPECKSKMVQLLLDENHRRYAEEQSAPTPKKSKSTTTPKGSDESLFGELSDAD